MGESGKCAIQRPFTLTKNFGVPHVVDFDLHSKLLPPLDLSRVQHFMKRVTYETPNADTSTNAGANSKDRTVLASHDSK